MIMSEKWEYVTYYQLKSINIDLTLCYKYYFNIITTK